MSHENVAAEFLASMPKSGEVQGEMLSASQFGSVITDLLSKIQWADLFAKAIPIYFILTSGGTVIEKINAIFKLFNLTPSPSLVAA